MERQQEEALGREGGLRPRAGRAGSFSLGLAVGFLLLGYAALRALELVPRTPAAARITTETPAESLDPGIWRARVRAGGTEVLALLLPLHDEPALEEFRARALRERYDLPAGMPWRLYLALAAEAPGPVTVSTARVRDGLQPFDELARARAGGDPVHALLCAPPGALEVGRGRPLVLWGELLEAAPVLELELAAGTGERIAGAATLERETGAAVPRWYADQALPRRTGPSLEEEVARLERELELERTRRAEREQAFLEFSRMLSELPVARELGLEPAQDAAPPPSAEELARQEEQRARRTRAEELGRALAVLMRLEGLRGLDLLDPGTLQGGPPAAIGPVVFRCLDERGALTGSLRAERLRLEASQAAHTLTLVLEDGHESHGGERVPFENGVRRITLAEVDPEPWLEECPELFGPREPVRGGDDGRWRLSEVRRELNRLLALDPRGGWYRLHSLGGVRGPVLLDVQLEELDPDGRLQRRYFADELVLALEDASVVLELQGGAIVRGGEKQPFRDGRHRIVLPGVALEPWLRAVLPGLAPAPLPEKPATAEAGGG